VLYQKGISSKETISKLAGSTMKDYVAFLKQNGIAKLGHTTRIAIKIAEGI